MDKNKLSSISKGESDESIGEFWDSHDFTEFDADAPDADFEVTCTIPVSKKGDSIQEISDYWGDASVEEIPNRVVEWKTDLK